MQISKNFTLEEFLLSQTATRKGYKEQYIPGDDIIDNIEALVLSVLQPIRDKVKGKIKISSGYRCRRLNVSVGGRANSQHLTGQAADIIYINESGTIDNKYLYDLIKSSGLVFDQLINEYDYSWVHVSYNKSGKNRLQAFDVK